MSDAIIDRARERLAKVMVIGDVDRERQTSNAVPDEEATRWLASDALVPPYDPRTLNVVFEASAALRPNIDAYVQNIDGNGSHLEPVIDLDGDDASELVANAIRLERLDAIDRGLVVTSVYPTEDEIRDRMRLLEEHMSLERFRIEAFIDGCVVGESFTSIRKKTRQDIEATGNGYWEVLRDGGGRVVQFVYLSSQTMRLRAVNMELIDVQVPIRVSPITVRFETLKHRFRSYVQITDTRSKATYFKEVGDPRVMSSATGKHYKTAMELNIAEPNVAQATEVMHFKIHSARSGYGVPRWVGALLSVMGSREAEEVNLLYFENKSVPPLAVLVSGGRLAAESADKIRDFISNEIKGKGNFHKILVIEAEGSDSSGENTGRMKIELKPLTSAQQSDALFQKYDERNHDKVGFQFRLPRMLRGDIRDFNKSTAEAALVFAESQVFGPERNEFDFMMNRTVLSSLGFRYWMYRSNAVQVRDPEKLADMIGNLTTQNVLVPADARKLVGELVFNRRFPRVDADWAYQPVMLTQVGVPFDTSADGTIPSRPTGGTDGTTPSSAQPVAPAKARMRDTYDRGGRMRKNEIITDARRLLELRDELAKVEEDDAKERFVKAAKDESELEPEIIRMSLAEARTKLGVVPS